MTETLLIVISPAPSEACCPSCGTRGLIFHCQDLRDRQIYDRCKQCAVKQAGSEDAIFIKTTYRGLSETWAKNRRRSETTSAARNAARASRERVQAKSGISGLEP